MNILDISWPITTGMTQYKDVKRVAIETVSKPSSNITEHLVSLHTHTGTHIDAPLHFIMDGISSDKIPLTHFVGPCRVLDLTHVETCITQQVLSAYTFIEDEIILFKTKNSALAVDASFNYNFVYLDASGAQFLVEQKIKTIGIDYLGIERNQPHHETHTLLLKNNIPIIEGLRLKQVQAGNYILLCLPLDIIGLDAAPARAVLLHI